jgi:MFS family permease
VLERRAADPLLPWPLLHGPLGPSVVLTFIGQVLSISVAFLLPLYLEGVRGLDAGHAGRWLAVLPVAALLSAPLAGQLADRLGARPLGIAGLVLAAAGDLVLGRMGVEAHGLLAGAILLGVGLGLFTVPNASNVMGSVPRSRLGTASGLQATMRNLGIASGTAASAAVVASLYARVAHAPLVVGATTGVADIHSLALAVGGAFLGLAGLAVLGAGIAGLAPQAQASHRAGD